MNRKVLHRLGKMPLVAGSLLIASMFACAPFGPSKDDAGTVTIDRVPMFSETAPEAKSVIPANTSEADAMYTIFAPPLTRFSAAPSSLTVGKSITVDLFGNPLELATSNDGSDILFSGKIIEKDGSGADVETGSIIVRYDPTASTFEYHSQMLVSDYNGALHGGPAMHFYVVTDIPRTTIKSDNSFVAKFGMIAYLGLYEEFQWIDSGELFSGPDDSGNWTIGFAMPTFSDRLKSELSTLPSINKFVDSNGKPLPQAEFKAKRESLVSARAVFSANVLDNGAPMIGYRVLSSGGTTTSLFNGCDASTAPAGYIYVGNVNGYLKNASGEKIALERDGNTSFPKRTLSNIGLLVTGLPCSAWRSSSALVSYCSTKPTFSQ